MKDLKKKRKTDKRGRIICRTALSEDDYMKLLEIKGKRKRSVAYLLREGVEEIINKYKPK